MLGSGLLKTVKALLSTGGDKTALALSMAAYLDFIHISDLYEEAGA